MENFYFNECGPLPDHSSVYRDLLSKTLLEFNSLLNEDLPMERGVITEKLPSEMHLGHIGSLGEIIESLENIELKKLAYSLFNRYPIDKHFTLDEAAVDNLLKLEYCLTVNNFSFDALNLAIAHYNLGHIFTVATHGDLQVNSLRCVSIDESTSFTLPNLFGNAANTKFILESVRNQAVASADQWTQLLHVVDSTLFSTAFQREFDKLRVVEQMSIVREFRQARARNLASPFYPDTKLIKEVTPDKPRCSVYELRIYTPTAIRVYFNESNGNVALGKIGFKSGANQNEDIKLAHNILNKLIKTGA